MEVVHKEVEGVSTIAAWREYRGFTQKELGKNLGVSQTQIAKWERPTARPRKATLEKLAAALECHPSVLTK
jgi:transcriptional regulator with XRE-family HTH domain